MNNLRTVFEQKLQECGEEERKKLLGELMYWGSCMVKDGTLWRILKEQICHQANKKGMSGEEFIDILFAQTDADNFMLILQA